MDNYRKITEEGQACRNCGTAVVKREHPQGWKPKTGQPYYFKWWLMCRNCRALYMIESAKVQLRPEPQADVDEQFRKRLEREK